MIDQEMVLPESLVGELIGKIGGITTEIDRAFSDLAAERDGLRARMLKDGRILTERVDSDATTDLLGLCIDGASLVETDRATSYGISCVTRVGPNQSYSDFRTNMFILPHLVNIDGLAAGFMMMQELMLAVETAKSHPQSVVFIDGSKVTFIIKINQFYTAFRDEGKKNRLDNWRLSNNVSDAGKVLQAFESRDWFADFIGLPNIVGLVKLVTSNQFISAYLPNFKDRFDDKVIAALVLDPGERMVGVPLQNPEAERLRKPGVQPNQDLPPYHLSDFYPYHSQFEKTSTLMTHPSSAHRISHNYFVAPVNNAIYKIESSGSLDSDRFEEVFKWLAEQSCAVDMLEPYPMYVADRFVKEAVAISKDAVGEITRTQVTTEWAFNFTGPYRTA